MPFPLLEPLSLADINEYAHASYMAARFPDGSAVAREWAATPHIRAYTVSLLGRKEFIATDETALWIHTGLATVALERRLSFAQPLSSHFPHAHRRSIPSGHRMMIGTQYTTTPERTAIDLLLKDVETGIPYLRHILASCPHTTITTVLRCSLEVFSKPGIAQVRELLRQLPDEYLQVS